MKKVSSLAIVLSFLLFSNFASAARYTVYCSFPDGLDWELTTTNSFTQVYLVGYCEGQGGTAYHPISQDPVLGDQ